MPADRLASGRRIQGNDVAAYFHTGGTTGAPKLAIHTHANQVFTAWAAVQCKTPAPATWSSTATRCSMWPAPCLPRWPRCRPASPPSSPRPAAAQPRGAAQLLATDRAPPRHLAARRADHPGGAGRGAAGRRGHFLAALLPHRRRAAAELAARFERQFGLHVNESLGMTEMAGISSISPPGSAFPVNCVGFPLPYVQVRIAALDAAPAGRRATCRPARPAWCCSRRPT